jgi:hypothetical protein
MILIAVACLFGAWAQGSRLEALALLFGAAMMLAAFALVTVTS